MARGTIQAHQANGQTVALCARSHLAYRQVPAQMKILVLGFSELAFYPGPNWVKFGDQFHDPDDCPAPAQTSQ